jgi:hypothetical protein
MNLPKIIKSNEFAVWVAIASMVAQSKHTFQAFLHSESLNPNWVDISFAVLVAVVIDLAVLFYTLRNRKDIAIGAMVAMILINGYAYWIIHDGLTVRFIAGIFFSLIIPLSVLFYSDEIKMTRNRKNDD